MRQAGATAELKISPMMVDAGVAVISRLLPDASEVMTLEKHRAIVRELLETCLNRREGRA